MASHMKKKATKPSATRELEHNLDESLRFIRSITSQRPGIGIVLGSGLGDFARTICDAVVIESASIPHYPRSTVKGHDGRLVFGKIGSRSVCALQGRVHLYESGNLDPVLYPIRLLHRLGIKNLIVTNAAGAINREFAPGDLMMMTDHINLTFRRPLNGMSFKSFRHTMYDPKLQKVIRRTAKDAHISLKEGVYCAVLGPSYETAAEIRMAQLLGADAVGMSTVNEVALATYLGMKVGGISCITNLSTGIGEQKLSHAEVTDVANQVKDKFAALLTALIRAFGK